MTENGPEPEKKKPSGKQPVSDQNEIPLPSRSALVRQTEGKKKIISGNQDIAASKHNPVIEKPSRTFSIKDVITDTARPAATNQSRAIALTPEAADGVKKEFNEETFSVAWKEFQESIKGEGPRIISMFKSINPRLEDDHTIIIPLTNAAQKDIFSENYRQKLLAWFKDRFHCSGYRY